MITHLFPMTPAQSWAFIGMVFAGALLLTYLIYGLDQFIGLAIWNCQLAGVKGIGYAIRGLEAYEILHEKVIEVAKNEAGYTVITSDTERNYRYFVIPSSVDEGNPDYEDAVRLAKGDDSLKRALLPESRVKNYFCLKNKETGKKTEFFVVYLKYDNQKAVETALQDFFDEEFYDACRETRDIA